MSCPSWQWYRTGYRWSPVRTLSVAPLWCDLGCYSRTVVVIKLRRTSAFTKLITISKKNEKNIASPGAHRSSPPPDPASRAWAPSPTTRLTSSPSARSPAPPAPAPPRPAAAQPSCRRDPAPSASRLLGPRRWRRPAPIVVVVAAAPGGRRSAAARVSQICGSVLERGEGGPGGGCCRTRARAARRRARNDDNNNSHDKNGNTVITIIEGEGPGSLPR